MTVIELLPIHNELDILQARVQLTRGHVDRHIVVEGDLTHQGHLRPPLEALPASVERHLAILPTGEGDRANWAREEAQRDALALFAGHLDPDDLILSCDVDELVDPHAIPRIADATLHGPVSLHMRMIYYGTREDPQGWLGAKALRAQHIPRSLSALRLSRCPPVRDCGWHLSYLGDTDRRRRKVEAYAHAENRQASAWARIAAGQDGPNGETLVPFDPAELPTTLQVLVP
jgi:beta-1,4-mannosyl-glycoprotein beta-1,4-N-acetylglucosaminyltransferase